MIEKYIQLSRGIAPIEDLIAVAKNTIPTNIPQQQPYIRYLILTYKIKNTFQKIEMCYGTSNDGLVDRDNDLQKLINIILTK